jgi:hypothetical protein
MSKFAPRTVAALGSAVLLGLALAPSQAQVIIDDGIDAPRPPSLLDFASAELTLYSGADAGASYFGSRPVEFEDCPGDSFQFWICRQVGYSESLGESAESFDGSMVSAEVRPTDFARTDTGGAGAKARAAAELGSLRAEAYADGGLEWQETRVTSANDATQDTITGRSTAFAIATSRWTDVMVASVDGPVTFELSLENHPGSYQAVRSLYPNTPLSADGTASLELQVFNLDVLTQYSTLSTEFQPFDGFLLVGAARDSRDESDSPTKTFKELTINLVAGQRYSIVGQLTASARNDAVMNLFGTGQLDRILVQPGQVLEFASGGPYNIAVVPVPAALPLLLSGIGAIAVAARRRRSASWEQAAR